MNVATILPQNYLHLTKDDDYFMCLGHLINKPGYEEYTEFFKERAAAGKFVIMDNGLIEGDQRPIKELAEKANAIGASEMVLTDVFCDCNATLDAIESDLHFLKDIDHPPVMLIAQGNTIEEWVRCAATLISRYWPMKFTLGVPKVLVQIGGRDGRIAALYRLCEICPIAKHLNVHLLGCWTTPIEILMLDKIQEGGSRCLPQIRGVDSAIPFVFARAGLRINESDRPDKEPIDFKHSDVDTALLKKNIKDWRKACSAKYRNWWNL